VAFSVAHVPGSVGAASALHGADSVHGACPVEPQDVEGPWRREVPGRIVPR